MCRYDTAHENITVGNGHGDMNMRQEVGRGFSNVEDCVGVSNYGLDWFLGLMVYQLFVGHLMPKLFS